MMFPVYITGLGVQTSIGLSTKTFSAALRAGNCSIKRVSNYPELEFPVLMAQLEGFNETLIASSLPGVSRLPYELQVTLAAAVEAWKDAGFMDHPPLSNRVGLVVTGDNLLPNLNFKYYKAFTNNPTYLSPKAITQCFDSYHLGVISEVLNITGAGFVAGGASASGNIALIQAQQLLQQESLDACLVVGNFTHFSPIAIQAFYNSGALGGAHFIDHPNKASRPFDKNRDGFILGEAAGAILLEKEKPTQRRSTVYGKILSGSMALSATQSTAPDITAEVRVMRQTLSQTQLSPKDITYLNTHGTSSLLGDVTEMAAIRTIFAEHLPKVWLNSTKSLIGHSLNSAGILEAIATIIQLKNNFLHPNINLDEPIDLQANWVGKKLVENIHNHYALSNSFGFFGIHTCLLLEKEE